MPHGRAAVLNLLNSDHFNILGKSAQSRLDFFDLLRAWLRYATRIVRELLLVDARNLLKGCKREYATVIVEQRSHIEIVDEPIVAIEHLLAYVTVFAATFEPEVHAILDILLKSIFSELHRLSSKASFCPR